MTDNTTNMEKELAEDAEIRMSLRVYLKFWSFVVKRQLVLFIGYAIFLAAMASLTPIFTFLWKRYIDTATVKGSLSILLWTLLFYVGIKLLLDFCYFFSMRFMDHINFSSWRVLDKAINEKAADIPGEYFEIPNIQNRIDRAWEFNHGSYIQMYQLGLDMVRYAAQIVGIFISLFIISPLLCGIACITIIPTIISKLVGDKISMLNKRELKDEEKELTYYKNAILDQALIKEIIIKNAFDFFQHKYESKAAKVFEKKKAAELKKVKLYFLEEAARNGTILICLLSASCQLIRGDISLGSLAAIFTLIFNLIYTLSHLVQNGCTVFTLTYSIKQFYEFMDLKGRTDETAFPPMKNETGSIDFIHVCYRYPLTDHYVLKNINAAIKKGQHVALVGANGSGKSTFVKLLLKLLEPSAGEIRYDAVNLGEVACGEYWELFSTVFQDYSRFKDTLRYNVSVSDFTAVHNDKKIEEALRLAEFDKAVDIDRMLSKEFGGIELSGGEWQKVALARSVFKANDIYILDEPTSAIDPIKESALYKRFAELTRGKTSIFVTHRLGSVLYSDLVLFFRDGEITEAGTHEELLDRKGDYFEFWNTQMSLYHIS